VHLCCLADNVLPLVVTLMRCAVVCRGLLWCAVQSDLALLTVTEDAFWTDLRPLEFIKETPELQV
jgi:hypothetical protein